MNVLTSFEREFLIERLLEGQQALLNVLDGLSEAQEHFRPKPESWSIADCVEHVAAVEELLFARITQGAPNPNGVSLDPEKDGRLAAAVVDRSRKFPAPPEARPCGRFASLAEAAATFQQRRRRAIAYARDCQQDLRHLFMQHPVLGEMDCYRCLLILALHPARHAAQIEEIKQQAGFPD